MSGQNWVLTGQILGLTDMLSGHLPTRSENFNFLLFDNHDGQHSCFRKKNKMNIKLDKLVVEKFPVVANFHDVIKSCHDRKSLCLPTHPEKHAWLLSFLVISALDATQ